MPHILDAAICVKGCIVIRHLCPHVMGFGTPRLQLFEYLVTKEMIDKLFLIHPTASILLRI
jgi:hypothetical protein